MDLIVYKAARDMGLTDEVMTHYGIPIPQQQADEWRGAPPRILISAGPVAEATEKSGGGGSTSSEQKGGGPKQKQIEVKWRIN